MTTKERHIRNVPPCPKREAAWYVVQTCRVYVCQVGGRWDLEKKTKHFFLVEYKTGTCPATASFIFLFFEERIFNCIGSGRSLSPSFFPDRGEIPKTPKFSFFYWCLK